jgi:hypothetical protein
MDCKAIPSVSIGNNYGGKLQSLSVSVGFDSPSSFEATFLRADQEFALPTLSSETPTSLDLGGLKVSVFPMSAKRSYSSAGHNLTVKYSDASIRFLDKHNVFLDYRKRQSNGSITRVISAPRMLYLVPIEITTSEGEADVEFGTYTGEMLYSQMSGKVPSSPLVESVLKSSSLGPLSDFGTLRDVLSSIGSKLGYVFYWNWAEGGLGELDAIKISNFNGMGSSLASSLKTTHFKKISSITESASIEDNVSVGDLGVKMGSQNASRTSTKSMTLNSIDISNCPWKIIIKRGADADKITIDIKSLGGKDWTKSWEWADMCAAAMVSEDVFNDYFMYHIGAASSEAWMETSFKIFSLKDGTPTERGTPSKVNELVQEIFKNFITSQELVAFKDVSKTPYQVMQDLSTARAPGRAEVFGLVMNDRMSEEGAEMLMKKGAYWISGVKVKEGIELEDAIAECFKVCELFGKNYNRFYVSASGITRKANSLYTFEKSPEWKYEKENVLNTEFSELFSYIMDLNGQSTENSKTAWYDFVRYFKSNDKADSTEEEANETAKPERDGHRGRLCKNIPIPKLSLSSPSKFLKVSDIDPNSQENITLSDISKQGYRLYVIQQNSDIVAKVTEVSDKFFQERKVKMTIFGTKTADVASPVFQAGLALPNQANPFSVRNELNLNTFDENYDLTSYMQAAGANVLSPASPAMTYNLKIEDFVAPEQDWLKRGMESYQLAYGGGDGVSTDITLGTRKKQRLSRETLERMIQAGSIADNHKIRAAPSSANKFAVGFNGARDR